MRNDIEYEVNVKAELQIAHMHVKVDAMYAAAPAARPSRRAGITIGIGMGGFVDGILLHQILEWHNMGSSILPPVTMDAMRQNMIWDGYFHAAVWAITLAGIYLLLHDARRRAAPRPCT